jgi:hypothetical protein
MNRTRVLRVIMTPYADKTPHQVRRYQQWMRAAAAKLRALKAAEQERGHE